MSRRDRHKEILLRSSAPSRTGTRSCGAAVTRFVRAHMSMSEPFPPRRAETVTRVPEFSKLAIAMVFFENAANAAVPQQARALIDNLVGGKGTYAADDGVYRIVFPREEATIVQDYQSLSPNLGLNSWSAFTSAIHHEAILTGQFLLLE